MKIIRTADYMTKNARDLPGNSSWNLPPSVTPRMIDDQSTSPFEDISDTNMDYLVERGGRFITVNVQYEISYMPGGEALPNIISVSDKEGNEVELSPEEEKQVDGILRENYDERREDPNLP